MPRYFEDFWTEFELVPTPGTQSTLRALCRAGGLRVGVGDTWSPGPGASHSTNLTN